MINELKLNPRQATLQVKFEYIAPGDGQWVAEPSYDFVCGLTDHGYEQSWIKAISRAKDISTRGDRRNVEVVLTIAGVSTVVTGWQEIRDFFAATWVPKLVKAEPTTVGVDPVQARINAMRNKGSATPAELLDLIQTIYINNLATHQTGSATPKGDN